MNILLICPKHELSSRSAFFPLGMLSIATYLNEKGHSVKLIDRSINKYDIEEVLNDFQPSLVGLSMMSTKAISDAIYVSKTVKEHNIPVVWGGTLTSSSPEFVLKSGVVDYVVMGEGEITIVALINAIFQNTSLHEVDGLAFIENDKIVINKYREFANLADLPILDFSLVDPSKYFRSFFACKKMLYMYGGKGCPSQCTFCTNKEYNRCTCRNRPIEYLLKEIEYLVRNCGLDGVYFTDEHCCKTKSEMHELCDHLKSTGLNFVWGATTKINGFSEDDFKYMYDSGCRWLFFGIESGSKERLAKIKKGIAYDNIVDTITNCYRAGIVAITGFIIGFPDETEEELHQTLDLALKMPFAMYSFGYFCPLPGSELHTSLKAEGRFELPPLLNDIAKITPFEDIIKNFSKIPTRDLKVVRAFFMMSVFTRRKPSKEAKPFALATKIVKEQFKDMARDGILMFIRNFASNTKTFLGILYYYIFFPGIRKKHGLHSTANKYFTDNS